MFTQNALHLWHRTSLAAILVCTAGMAKVYAAEVTESCIGYYKMKVENLSKEERRKLGPGLLRRLLESADRADSNQSWLVLLQFAHKPSPAESALLQRHGFQTRSKAGDVLTGTVCASDLKNLVALEAVVKVDASEPLSGEIDKSRPSLYE